MSRACSINGVKTSTCSLTVRKLEGMRPLGRPTRRWVDTLRQTLETGCDGVVWTQLLWSRIRTSGGLL
jgi:hypothetical protein